MSRYNLRKRKKSKGDEGSQQFPKVYEMIKEIRFGPRALSVDTLIFIFGMLDGIEVLWSIATLSKGLRKVCLSGNMWSHIKSLDFTPRQAHRYADIFRRQVCSPEYHHTMKPLLDNVQILKFKSYSMQWSIEEFKKFKQLKKLHDMSFFANRLKISELRDFVSGKTDLRLGSCFQPLHLDSLFLMLSKSCRTLTVLRLDGLLLWANPTSSVPLLVIPSVSALALHSHKNVLEPIHSLNLPDSLRFLDISNTNFLNSCTLTSHFQSSDLKILISRACKLNSVLFECIFEKLPNLDHFDVSFTEVEGYAVFSDTPHPLTKLGLQNCYWLKNRNHLTTIAKKFRNLAVLDISNNISLDHISINQLANFTSSLEIIDLSGLLVIDNECIVNLVNANPKLKEVYIYECEYVDEEKVLKRIRKGVRFFRDEPFTKMNPERILNTFSPLLN